MQFVKLGIAKYKHAKFNLQCLHANSMYDENNPVHKGYDKTVDKFKPVLLKYNLI